MLARYFESPVFLIVLVLGAIVVVPVLQVARAIRGVRRGVRRWLTTASPR